METYNGLVRTPTDAIILFEACRIGLLPRVQRRLSEKERQSIKSGSVFVWDEREAGMRRWTDGKSWSASRVSGSFLTYREMEGKRGGPSYDKNANRDGILSQEGDSDGGGPDGYRYKLDGLMKQSFSITTNQGQHLHLISYYSRMSSEQTLLQPSSDPQLRHIRPEKGMYPDSSAHEQSNIPAVTRGPMTSPGYTHAPPQAPPYGRGQPPYHPHHPSWAPPSPMHTPPPHNHNSGNYSQYYHQPSQSGYPAHSSLQNVQYPPSHSPYAQPPTTTYDRPPPPMSNPNGPPPTNGATAPYQPPAGHYPAPPNQHPYPNGNYSQPPPNYNSAYPPNYAPPSAHPPPPPGTYPPSHQLQYDPRPHQHDEPQPPSHKRARTESHVQNDRQSSHARTNVSPTYPSHVPEAAKAAVAPATAAAGPPPPPPSTTTTSGQTIPSISAMLNGGDPKAAARTSSRSPTATGPNQIHDIPSHKLGFEANRDVQALRNLDKTTFKQY